MKALITCPRAPVALEWIKIAQRSGYQVILVDSLDHPIARFSENVDYIKIPSPKLDFENYSNVMRKLFEQVDIVIPTCEDIFHLSRIAGIENIDAKFFMPSAKILFKLHHKFEFFELLNQHIKLPKTRLLTDKSQIEYKPNFVLKPVYSRFGRDVIRDITAQATKSIEISKQHPWVEQEFIKGQAICNFAICDNGKVISHVVYRPKYLLNQAAATYFEFHQDSRCEAFIMQFVAEHNYTGQVAFDFIDNGADLYVLECNPRATSGLHFMGEAVHIDEKQNLVKIGQVKQNSFRLGYSLFLMFGLKYLFNGEIKTLIADYKKAENIIGFLPLYSQFLSFFEMLKLAVVHRLPLTSTSTFDIEYNGEADD